MEPMLKIIQFVSGTEFSRYFWAGSLTFLVDFLILLVLTELFGINYLWSNLGAVSVGILMSYLLSVKWIFLDRRFTRTTVEFPLFVLLCFVGLSLNESLLWALVAFAEIHYLIAKVLVTAAVFAVSFFVKKMVLFSR